MKKTVRKKSIYTEQQAKVVDRLIKARKEAGFTQEEVAEKLGMSQSHVSRIEMKQIRIDIVELQMFAKLYKKNLDYFVG